MLLKRIGENKMYKEEIIVRCEECGEFLQYEDSCSIYGEDILCRECCDKLLSEIEIIHYRAEDFL